MEFGKIGKGLTKEKKEQIEALKLPGVSFITENARVYPNGDFASYVIGHAKPNEDGIAVGQFGLEKSLDKYLGASNGGSLYRRCVGGIS